MSKGGALPVFCLKISLWRDHCWSSSPMASLTLLYVIDKLKEGTGILHVAPSCNSSEASFPSRKVLSVLLVAIKVTGAHTTPGFPGGSASKEPACQRRRHKWTRFNPWVGKIPWRRKWQPTPVFLPREFHGQQSLADHTELDTTEGLIHTHTPLLSLFSCQEHCEFSTSAWCIKLMAFCHICKSFSNPDFCIR